MNYLSNNYACQFNPWTYTYKTKTYHHEHGVFCIDLMVSQTGECYYNITSSEKSDWYKVGMASTVLAAIQNCWFLVTQEKLIDAYNGPEGRLIWIENG